MGGTFIEEGEHEDPSEWSWVDVDELEDILAEGQELVLDFEVVGEYGFFATPLGAFRMDKDMFDAGADIGSVGDILTEGMFFEIREEGKPLQILSLAYDEKAERLYMGTVDGVYKAKLGSNAMPKDPKLVSRTDGFRFPRVLVNDSYDVFFSTYELFVIESGSGKLEKLPFYAGLPGRLTGAAWKGAGNILYISGSGLEKSGEESLLGIGGLIAVDVDELF
jgi:hypothetical protein